MRTLDRSVENDAWRFRQLVARLVAGLSEDCRGADELWFLAFYACGLLSLPAANRAEARRSLFAEFAEAVPA